MKGLSNMCEQPHLLLRCDCLIVDLTLFQTESSWGGWWMMGGGLRLGLGKGEVISALMHSGELLQENAVFKAAISQQQQRRVWS